MDEREETSPPEEFEVLTRDDIRLLKTTAALFARKFTEASDVGAHWHSIVSPAK
jgi:hypothetical protein